MSTRIPLADALRTFELFRGLTDEEMQWFVENASDEIFEEGTLLVRNGDEADSMSIIVEGQIRFQSAAPDSPVMIVRPGIATGLLPYSRLQRYSGNGYALTRCGPRAFIAISFTICCSTFRNWLRAWWP